MRNGTVLISNKFHLQTFQTFHFLSGLSLLCLLANTSFGRIRSRFSSFMSALPAACVLPISILVHSWFLACLSFLCCSFIRVDIFLSESYAQDWLNHYPLWTSKYILHWISFHISYLCVIYKNVPCLIGASHDRSVFTEYFPSHVDASFNFNFTS